MDFLYFESYRCRGSNYKPFFTGRIIENKTKKTEHKKQIIDIYKNWRDTPSKIEVDL